MKISTSSGKTFDVEWAMQLDGRYGMPILAIQLPGTTTPAEIVEGLVGAELIEAHKKDGTCEPYAGFTLLSSITYAYNRKTVRVTLEKEESA